MKKTMDHTEYQKRCRSMSEAALRYTIADATAARDAMPGGQNDGHYADEVCYAAMELRRRVK